MVLLLIRVRRVAFTTAVVALCLGGGGAAADVVEHGFDDPWRGGGPRYHDGLGHDAGMVTPGWPAPADERGVLEAFLGLGVRDTPELAAWFASTYRTRWSHWNPNTGHAELRDPLFGLTDPSLHGALITIERQRRGAFTRIRARVGAQTGGREP